MAKSIESDAHAHSRFRVLWAFLVWEGGFRNARLAELFGVGSMQASRIIAEFREQFPGIVEREKYEWVGAGSISPPVGMGSLREYLTLAPSTDIERPAVFDARLSFLEPDPATFRLLHRAAASRSAVSIGYASMSSGLVAPRVIYPQILVQLGLRWHIRAWCTMRDDYRDFNLGRISDVKVAVSADSAAFPADTDWNTILTVRLRAHSLLGAAREKIVRDEYFRGTMGYRAEVRAALLKYWLQEARVAIDPKKERPPEYLLQLHEPQNFSRHLFGDHAKL